MQANWIWIDFGFWIVCNLSVAADSSDPFHWVGVPVPPLIDKQLAVVLKLNVVNCCPVRASQGQVQEMRQSRVRSAQLRISVGGTH